MKPGPPIAALAWSLALLVILALKPGPAQGLCLDTSAWHDFEGTVGAARIRLALRQAPDGSVQGSYFYTKYETVIPLRGALAGDELRLEEHQDGRVNGVFLGTPIPGRDQVEGTWTSADGTKTYPFSLRLIGISGGQDGYREDASGQPEAPDRFAAALKKHILAGDRPGVAAKMAYPLRVGNIRGKPASIRTRNEFLALYEDVFTPEFVEKIRKAVPLHMFSNAQGIMFGDSGEIWIRTVVGQDGAERLAVITINN